MKSRERVKRAVELKELDRVPLDLGATTTSGIHYAALDNLRNYMKIEGKSEVISTYAQIAKVDEELLKKLRIDTRFIQLRPSSNVRFDGDFFYDEWGIGLKKITMTSGAITYELRESPLKDATLEDLDKYKWPDPYEESRIAGLKEEAEELYQNSDYWVIGTIGVMAAIFEIAHHLRSMDRFMMDLVVNKKFAKTLLEIITDIQIKKYKQFFKAVGSNVNMVMTCDDVATQTSTMVSPQLYRETIKPCLKKLIDFIKSEHSDVKIFYHCCGSASYLLDDFIDVGIDAINPVQVTADNMNPAFLKNKFGKRI